LPAEFVEKLAKHSRFLLTPHESPDADAVGSSLGLAWHLHSMGKEFRIIVSPKVPNFLKFLDTQGWIEAYSPDEHGGIASWPDCWVMLDANELGRLGPLKKAFMETSAARACIDHHLYGNMESFDFFVSKPDASSTCELIAEALAPKDPMRAEMASAIYAGIVDDTGSFKFSCTTPQVHRLAAALLEMGARPDEISHGLYNQASEAKIRIFGSAYNQLRLYADGQLALMTVSLADLESAGATHEDLEGLVSRPLELKTVEVAILAYEKPNGTVKVSMRSKSRVDINAVCRQFGGGGHRLASGASFEEPLEEAVAKILPMALKAVSN
jgi:phosphoesterase RecJ-like protein